MLTKSDLSQIERIMEPIKTDISSLKQDVGVLKQDVGSLKKDAGSLKKDMKYVKKTVDVMIDLFDRQDIRLSKRVDKIESHLGLANP